MMIKNPILDELRKTREKLLTDAGGTLAGLVAQLQRDERRSGRKFVTPTAESNQTSDPEHSKRGDQSAAAGAGSYPRKSEI